MITKPKEYICSSLIYHTKDNKDGITFFLTKAQTELVELTLGLKEKKSIEYKRFTDETVLELIKEFKEKIIDKKEDRDPFEEDSIKTNSDK